MQLVRRNLDLEGSVKICEGKIWGKYKYRSSDKGTQSSDMPDLTLETHLMQRYPQSAEIRSEAVMQFLF
jgi:hypothetical protein